MGEGLEIIKIYLKSIADKAFLRLLGFVGYWSGGLHNFCIDEDSTQLSALMSERPVRKLFLVVARKHYFETVKDYPVGSLRDLKGILKNELWRYPYKGKLIIRIKRISDHSHRVTSWVIRKDLIDRLSANPLFIIPESACLQVFGVGEAVSLERLGSSMFASMTVSGLVSIEGEEAIFRRYINADLDGEFEEDISLTRLSQSDSLDVILVGMFKSLMQSPNSFYNGPNWANLRFETAQHWVKVTAVLVSIYLGITSLFIGLSDRFQEKDLMAIRPAAQEVARIRDLAFERKRVLDAINEAISRRGQISTGWDLLLDLKSMGVVFFAVNTTDTDIEIFCNHVNATEVLQFLRDDFRVLSAELSSAIQKENGGERFSVKIGLRRIDYSEPPRQVFDRSVKMNALKDSSGFVRSREDRNSG